MGLKFGEYEDWMKDQVISMFCEEYGNEREQFADYFNKFYSGFQQGRSVRIVMLEGKKVAGFVSFSYWPYLLDGKRQRSYQCGNVIIHKDYRGRGLYNQMLDHLNSEHHKYEMDFLVGFPIRNILKLYLRSGWKNPFNLRWYVKVINPAGKLFGVSDNRLARAFSKQRTFQEGGLSEGGFELDDGPEFRAWNESYNNLAQHYFFAYRQQQHWVEFSLKLNKRKYLNELVIGEITGNTSEITFLSSALQQLRKRAFSLGGISILSFCFNELRPGPLQQVLLENGFKRIERDIKFIVRNFNSDDESLTDPRKWKLFRRDLDTW